MRSHDEMIAVIQAHKEGKTIQFRNHHGKGSAEFQTEWTDCVAAPHWDFPSVDYRVKPQPREWWLIEEPARNARGIHHSDYHHRFK